MGNVPAVPPGTGLGLIPLEMPSRTNLSISVLNTFFSFSTTQKLGLRVKLPFSYPA